MAIINPITFLLSRTIAQDRGVSDAEANRLGFVGSVIRPPILGIVLASAIASNEAASGPTTTGSSTTGSSATGSSATGGSTGQSGGGSGSMPQLLTVSGMPSFHGMDKALAETWATNLGLKTHFEGAHTSGEIDWQQPAIGKAPPPDGVVKLRFAKRSDGT